MALLAETERTMIIPPRFAAYPQCEDALWRSVQRAMTGELLARRRASRRAAADVQQHRRRRQRVGRAPRSQV